MEGYPAGSLDHNVPLLVVSGLKSKTVDLDLDGDLKEQGILLRSDQPPLESREADALEEHFAAIDAEGASWTAVQRDEGYRLRVKTVGRSFLLPPRRARLPESIEQPESVPILHSPFSPLSPASRLYPDGLMDSQWIKKHQKLVPSIYTCFYRLSSDPTMATLHDNRLKADINDIKGALSSSGYKTRLAVILLGESGAGRQIAPDGLQDRLDNLRKGTALDARSIFFVPYQESLDGLRRAVDAILNVLYNTAIEYYRDLGRHARKKRSRGVAPAPTIPPTSGTSKTLSLPDWNFRYDFKSAVFAEFRQELDTALRSFEQAYEILLGQDVLDTIPSWSPRWNEARLLSDVVSIRCVRLHLWMGQSSLAVRRWQSHRDRISDFVDRRGRGTNNYGWQAWEARWAMVMANLIEKVEVPGLSPPTKTFFLQPEKALLGERLQPWELLHHTGYWYRIAARHLAARRTLAHMMPEEDRNPPDASPASQVASKAYMYDSYMCPPPHQEYAIVGTSVNHSQLIIDCLIMARTQFQARKQLRIASELSLECAREMATMESWKDVVAILRPLWEDLSFRSDGWLDISEELCWLMRRAAAQTGRGEIVVAIDWELMNKKFTRRPHWHYDLAKALDGVEVISRPIINMADESSASFITAAFVFRNKQSKAGDTCTAQLSLQSNALPNAAPVVLSSISINFEGSLKPIVLEHDSSENSPEGNFSVSLLTLTEVFDKESSDELPAKLRGQCNLSVKAGERRVFELTIPLRESGEAEASSVILSCHNKAFDLDYTLQFRETDAVVGWYVEGSERQRHARIDARRLQIEPRPPKMDIKLVQSLGQYYANEQIELRFELLNAEDETSNVKLDVHVFGKEVPAFRVQIGDQEQGAEAAPEESAVTGLVVGHIKSSESLGVVIRLDAAPAPTVYDLHVRASYHLESDVATPITQVLPIQLNVVNAFEANYELLPRLHPEPWPSLFDYEGLGELSDGDDDAVVQARGFAQKWSLLCHYASFALEDLTVVGVEMQVVSCVGGARCNVVTRPELPVGGTIVAPKTMYEAQFDLVAQKLSLDDRQPVSLDLAFIIKWKRQSGDSTAQDSSSVNTTTMLVGQYLILGSEPRVLASVAHGVVGEGSNLMQLDMTIENPSQHFLTFGLAMEPSDSFAFSGAKQTTVHLLPMSRRTVTYRLLPTVKGAYVRPGLVVRDKYFQKVLRVIPTEGMKIDKDGLLVWVPGETDDEDDEDESSQDSSS